MIQINLGFICLNLILNREERSQMAQDINYQDTSNRLLHKGFLYFIGYVVFTTIFYYLTPLYSPAEKYELIWPLLLGLQIIFKIKGNFEFFFVLLIILAVRFFLINFVSVWLDEEIQAFTSLAGYPVGAGLFQHQPPLDIIFMKFGILISRYSVWGLRLHAAVFSALAGSYFYILVKKISKSVLVATVMTFFFCFHKYSVQYGFEARPISLGLFLEVLFISFVFNTFGEENDLNQRPWLLSSLTLMYLSSLGLQSVFIVGGTLIFLFLVCFFNRKHIKNFMAVAIGFLCFLPLQFIIYVNAPARFTKPQGFSFSLLFSEFEFKNFSFLETYFTPWIFILLALSAVNIYFMVLKKRSVSEYVPIAYLTLVVSFICLTLIPFFLMEINWRLQPYYLVSVLPLILLMVPFLWRLFVKENSFNIIVYRIGFVGISCLAFLFYDWGTYDKVKQRDDLKGPINSLKKNRGPAIFCCRPVLPIQVFAHIIVYLELSFMMFTTLKILANPTIDGRQALKSTKIF